MIQVFAKHTLLIALLCTPLIAWGDDTGGYVRLVGIPYYGIGDGQNVEQYLNALYRIAISIAAMLAVLRLIMAGAKYILTDIVPAKQDAKKDIRSALVGLLIVLSAVFLLQIINDNLINFNFLDGLNRGFEVQLQTRPNTVCDTDTCRAAACTTGQEYVRNPDNPDGACITPIILTDEDYTNNPDEGRSFCQPLEYDEATNSCYSTDNIARIPDNLVEQWEDVGEVQYIIDSGNEYCNRSGQNFILNQRACIDVSNLNNR